MVLPPAHIADHWAIYIAYSAPVIVVSVAIVTSAIRERVRRDEDAEPASSAAMPGDDRERP